MMIIWIWNEGFKLLWGRIFENLHSVWKSLKKSLTLQHFLSAFQTLLWDLAFFSESSRALSGVSGFRMSHRSFPFSPVIPCEEWCLVQAETPTNLLPWEITVQTRETKVSERWSHQIFYVMKSWVFFPEPSNLSESERDEINTQIVTEVTSKDLVSFVQLSNFPIFSLLWKETFWVIFDHCKKYFLIKI